jgi:hypothetical protein
MFIGLGTGGTGKKGEYNNNNKYQTPNMNPMPIIGAERYQIQSRDRLAQECGPIIFGELFE